MYRPSDNYENIDTGIWIKLFVDISSKTSVGFTIIWEEIEMLLNFKKAEKW